MSSSEAPNALVLVITATTFSAPQTPHATCR